jgi:pimeloyl-ACP methyl ester carboxylesterase
MAFRGIGLAAIVICLTVAAATAAAGSGPPAPVIEGPAAPAALGDCGEKAPHRLRCGRLDVPLERADPGLGSISIRFGVLPRSRPEAPSRGAILAVEGGPGYGSIGSARDYRALFGSLLRRRDLLVVDQRGTAGSGAIDCPDLQRGTGLEDIALAACAEQLGDAYGSYRTSASADDLDSVREALGYERVLLYGDSYGTYLAQSYAFRHPQRVRRIVLDSAYPVRGESPWYPSTWRTGIRSLQTACSRSRRCPAGAPERLERIAGLLRKRDRGVGPLLTRIANAGYAPPASYLRIDRAIRAYLEGRARPYRRLTRPRRSGSGDAFGYSRGLELAVSCNDYPMLWEKGAPEAVRRRRLQDEIAGYPRDRFAPFTPKEIALTPDWGYLACLAWPGPSPFYEPAADPAAEPPDVPVLVVSGELDDVTSPREGREAAALFEDSEFFLAPNAGHVSSLYDPASPEARRIRSFLRG